MSSLYVKPVSLLIQLSLPTLVSISLPPYYSGYCRCRNSAHCSLNLKLPKVHCFLLLLFCCFVFFVFGGRGSFHVRNGRSLSCDLRFLCHLRVFECSFGFCHLCHPCPRSVSYRSMSLGNVNQSGSVLLVPTPPLRPNGFLSDFSIQQAVRLLG